MRQVYQDNTNPDNEIYKISFYSPSAGYVAFRDWIGFTADSGRTFTKKYITLSNVDYNGHGVNLTFGFGINGVKAFSQDTLLAYGDYGFVPAILYSTNGGSSFKLIYHSQYDPWQLRTGITDMVFPQNGSIGYACDADRVLKTTDRGLTWTMVHNNPGSYFDHLQAVDNNNFIAWSTRWETSKMVKTTMGGNNWGQITLPADQKVQSAYFLTAQKGWMSTSNNDDGGRTYYTSDGGASWTLKNNPDVAPMNGDALKFVNDSTGYMLEGLFTVLKTTDGGKIWERLPRDNNFEYLGYSHNDLHFWNNNQLWAGGGHGFLELSTNGGGTVIPTAYFAVDTAGLSASGTMKLVNHSKPGYRFQWLVNNAPVSTGYSSTYTHDRNSTLDSIQLIVTNGSYADTVTQYQYFHPPVIVTSFSPTSGAGGTVVTIQGKNFRGTRAVHFGSAPASFTLLNDSTIRATVGGGASGSVRVDTETGFGSLPGFTFIPPPVVSSFTPEAAAAGTTVTLTGQNFIDVTAVSFGGVAAASFRVLSATTIEAVVGIGATGSIAVTAIGGTGTKAGFEALPVISSFTPAAGTFGTLITISGTGFGSTTAVSVGGTPVASFTIQSHTSITAVLAHGATGDVVVSTAAGRSQKASFSWYLPPVVSGFSPASGAVGTTVTITGSQFDEVAANNVVYFGSVRATVVSGTASSLTVTVPVGAGYGPISVTSHNLTGYSSRSFVVSFPNGGTVTASSFATLDSIARGPEDWLAEGVTGDVDGDGKVDIVVIKHGYYVKDNSVTVYRNTGTGAQVSFAPRVEYHVPDPGGVVLSDFDGDGKLDFAVTDGDTYNLSFWRNTSTPGSVSFDGPVTLTTARMGGRLAVEDIDGDGKTDIVFSSWWEGRLVVHRNTSNPGSIAFGPRIDLLGPSERNLVLRDMDGDGKPDLVDASRVFKNTSTKGSISFAAPVEFGGYTHSTIAVGDVDGDGKADIVASDPYGSKAVVYRNTTAGALSFAPEVLVDAVSTPTGILLADLDGDSKLEIATALYDYRLGIIKNTSTPGSVSFNDKVNFLPGAFTGDNLLTSGDMNGDGKTDVIVWPYIFLNNAKPEPFVQSFTPTMGIAGTTVTIRGTNFTQATAVSFGGVAAASFTVTSDSTITAVVGTGASGAVTVTNSYGTGTKAGYVHGNPPVITHFSPAAGPAGSAVIITGANFSTVATENIVYFGSVKAVVAAASATSLTVTVPYGTEYMPISVTVNHLTAYSNKPFVTTFPVVPGPFTQYSFGDASHFAGRGGFGSTADLDGDGLLDVVLISGDNSIKLSRNTTVDSVLSFAPAVTLTTGSTPTRFAFGDVDGDGRQDIVVTHDGSTFVSVLLNNGTPGNLSYAPRVDFTTGWSASGDAVAIRDMDGDGKPEIIIAGYSPHTVSVFRNQSTPGTAAFATRIDYLVDGYPTDMKVADIDGDNRPDILAAVNSGDEVSVFRNTSVPGTISFALKADFAAGDWPTTLTVGDMDGDGKTDVAVANVNGNSVTVLHNQSTAGTASFAPKTDLVVSYRPWTVWLNDLDGDGKPELGVQKETSNFIYSDAMDVSVYKNNSEAGTIRFAAPVQYPVGDYTVKGSSADMDADGRPDLVVYASMNNYSSSLLILRNKIGKHATVRVCANSGTAIGSNIKGAAYQWQQNTGAGFVNIANSAQVSGATTDTLRLLRVPAAWANYQYRCIVGGDTSVTSVLAINELPLADAGPDKGVCYGNPSAVIGTPAVSGNTYLWDPAVDLNSAYMANPTASPSATMQYTLTVTGANGCVAHDTVVVNLLQPAAPVVGVGGPVGFCTGGHVELSAPASDGYRWFINGFFLGDTLQTLRATQSGVYTLITITNGCLSPFSEGVRVTATPQPAAPVLTASGPLTFCHGKEVTLMASDTGRHVWYRDGVLLTSVGGPYFTATQSGSYTATKINNGCQSALSNALMVTVTNTLATPALTAAGPLLFCDGGAVTLNSSAPAGNVWYRNDTVVNGAAQPAYTATQSGSYKVKTVVDGCTSAFSNTINVTEHGPLPAPVISRDGTVLTSSATAGNQWYLNGAAIAGATGQSLATTTYGVYTVKVTQNGCTSPFSSALTLLNPGITVGPNPVADQLVIQYPNNTEPCTVLLLDLSGAVLERATFVTTYTIDMRKYTPGTYIVQIINPATGEKEQRVVVKL
jgi:photosystem II stability/assembly factor-like uncharacterized protein